MQALEIQKYGGTSMADGAAMVQSATCVKRSLEHGKAILVVNSALSGVTTQIQEAMRSAVNKGVTEEDLRQEAIRRMGDPLFGSSGDNYWSTIKAIDERRQAVIDDVVDSKKSRDKLHNLTHGFALKARRYVDSMVTLKLLEPHKFDWISAYMGEGSDAPIFHAVLQSAGIDTVYYDAASIIVTDGILGNANPLIGSIREKSSRGNLVTDLTKGRVVVMGGYYGEDLQGNINTFSRGGSDLSATVVGRSLTPMFEPISVYLFKADVASVMSADPKIIRNTHIILHMLYEEGAALTAHGGKVIHPKAVQHAVRSGSSKRTPFPIYVKSTTKPEDPGTTIDNIARPEDDPVKAVSIINNAVRLIVRGWGMDQPGIMSKITGALAAKRVDIDFIGQPFSKLGLDLACQFDGQEADLKALLEKELEAEIRRNDIDFVEARRVGVIGVIGAGLSDPLILSRMIEGMNGDFPELRKPNSYKLTTGPYESTLLLDLSGDRLYELAQSIHDCVFSATA